MNLAAQFGRFVGVGIVGLLVLLGITYALTEYFRWWYFLSFVIGTVVSWTSIFFLNSFFTFSGHDKSRYGRKYVFFIATYLGAFIVNAGLVYFFTSRISLYYLLSITLATAFTTVVTFALSKLLIFTYGNKD